MISFILRALVHFYRLFISPLLRPRCRFLPTCSQYTLDALEHYGPYKGSILALKRVCRCHPWGGHGFDPVKRDEP
jgi:putative membrane protein insertion efficiency factor